MRSTTLSRRLVISFLLACGVLSSAPASHAEPTASDKESARTLWAEGTSRRAKDDHEAALKAFEGAHAIMGLPTTGIEVAREREATGRLVEARDMALQVAKMSGSTADELQARADALQLYESLGPRIPTLEIDVSGAAAGVKVTVRLNGAELPEGVTALPRRVNPGTHTVTVEAPGYRSVERSATLAEAGTARIQISLSPEPAARQEPARGVSSPAPPAVDGLVKLHIEPSNPTVAIYQKKTVTVGMRGSMSFGSVSLQPEYGEQLSFVCAAPCDKLVDGSDGTPFVFKGTGTVASKDFRLLGMSGEVTARVAPATEARHKGGAVLLALGLSGVTGAIAAAVIGAAVQVPPSTSQNLWIAGGIAGGVSSGLLGVGAYLLATGSTTFQLVPGAPTRVALAPGGISLGGQW